MLQSFDSLADRPAESSGWPMLDMPSLARLSRIEPPVTL
jgi:hypothetical protein